MTVYDGVQMPRFQSLDELVKFFDTHDLGDYWEQMPEAHFEVDVTRMRAFTTVVEKCPDTGLYVGYVPGFPGAHSQAATLDELQHNLREVIGMLLEDGEPALEAEFIGTPMATVA